jgi:hypothetical protein
MIETQLVQSSVTNEWCWEGNVVSSFARYLREDGWTILSLADTLSKGHGVDIHARRGMLDLLVEVKGYPSTRYRDPRRADEIKPTNPTNQAQQWYSHAILKALRLRTKYPLAKIALGLPDFPRYRTLFRETQSSLATLDIALLFVSEAGSVSAWQLD